MESISDRKKTVVFFHPDLGIGGAERLVVDAALGLQNRGHKVVIFTSHCDQSHCFEEARDGTLDVRVRGNWPIPSSIFSRFTVLCAILRQLQLITQTWLTGEVRGIGPDSFFVDQLSAGLPVLQYFYAETPIFFYCHFPDMLLAQGRQNWWKRLYRLPFDWLEAWSMGFAAEIAVNSEFTKSVATYTWPSLAKRRDFKVVYPCVDLAPEHPAKPAKDEGGDDDAVWRDDNIILSINRFERKKDIALAIKSFAFLTKEKRKGVRLVIAGGYDPRSTENFEYHRELVDLAKSLGLESFTAKNIITALSAPRNIPILFLLSVPSALKASLLRSARLLLYTPSNEHFGIVPLEAMLSGVPVLAANTGGPRETVVDGETGWLREPGDVAQWAEVIEQVLNKTSKEELRRMGEAGAERVKTNFGRERLAERLEEIQGKMKATWMVEYRAAVFIFGVTVLAPIVGKLAVIYSRRNNPREEYAM
ncbi:glycosyl transferase group 1 [Sodiomyces alkalinus F11]|uniref:Alpha-1,3/1,6-mannosyltransferase ALG2 n=1 Tax=Sodiomyces alkalinus (strain CBS 110278 / VKM F-3762 / F11) TaxID=1314773 RepID=A0A3N2Q6Z2_SODAK|nr:glycosyl transferase group 1 [Sodiomyces alkalinus F11]ROT42385.1 glycosyl transferase group 1 [Sodiomyces alkalinus F11]